LLWSLKPAEDGIDHGITARVWNQSNSPVTYSLGLSKAVTSADKVTHIETLIAPATIVSGQLSATVNQQQMQTHILRVAASRP
jgi:hypothetical protein